MSNRHLFPTIKPLFNKFFSGSDVVKRQVKEPTQ